MIYLTLLCSMDRLALSTVVSGVGFFLGVTLLLVVILLIAKKYLVQSGEVTITMNGDTKVTAESGKSFLPHAVVKEVVASAVFRSKRVGVRPFLQKLCTSPAKNLKTIGVWPVR